MKESGIPRIISLVAISSGLFVSPLLAKESSVNQQKTQQNASAKEKQFRTLKTKLEAILKMNAQDKGFKKEERKLSVILARLERLKYLNPNEEKMVGWTLNRLANIHCPSQTEPDCKSFDDKSFEKGNAFKRREFELHCQLHPERANQIRYNFALLNWYLDRRRVVEVESQRRVLNELLGTLNPIIPDGRSFCGKLLNDENGHPISNSSVDIGCGLG